MLQARTPVRLGGFGSGRLRPSQARRAGERAGPGCEGATPPGTGAARAARGSWERARSGRAGARRALQAARARCAPLRRGLVRPGGGRRAARAPR